eukprot:NODE_21_length_42443_cov_0.822808.p17 type:complete len:293 gc:universal NODE_21_length_42443_cov_0.822808:42327-41449(-)
MYDFITIRFEDKDCSKLLQDKVIDNVQLRLHKIGDFNEVFRSFDQTEKCEFSFSVQDKSGVFVEGQDLQIIKDRLISDGDIQASYVQSYKDHVEFNSLEAIMMLTFAIIGVVVIILFIIILTKYRKTPAVKSSSYFFNMVILIGLLISYSAFLFELGVPTQIACHLRIWVYSLSFTIVYGTFLLKTRRIYVIFNNTKGSLNNISDMFVLAQLFMLLFIVSALCLVYSVVNSPIPQIRTEIIARAWSCQSSNYLLANILDTSLLFFALLMLLISSFYCYKTRNCQGAYKERYF